MVSARSMIVPLAAALISGAAFAQDAVGYGSKPPAASQAVSENPKPPLTPERRADILMARKMYREAIEIYEEAPQNSAVVWNKKNYYLIYAEFSGNCKLLGLRDILTLTIAIDIWANNKNKQCRPSVLSFSVFKNLSDNPLILTTYNIRQKSSPWSECARL